MAQITAISQVVTRQLPPGITPPMVIQYNASSVPILQLGLGGKGLSEQMLYDPLPTSFARSWPRSRAPRSCSRWAASLGR